MVHFQFQFRRRGRLSCAQHLLNRAQEVNFPCRCCTRPSRRCCSHTRSRVGGAYLLARNTRAKHRPVAIVGADVFHGADVFTVTGPRSPPGTGNSDTGRHSGCSRQPCRHSCPHRRKRRPRCRGRRRYSRFQPGSNLARTRRCPRYRRPLGIRRRARCSRQPCRHSCPHRRKRRSRCRRLHRRR